ncbi:MAG TPA: arginine deiminase family protein [Acidobacteriota bacterium]|nr:arginine deiminase family protein [Acidobacteriota bacterium]
MVPRYDCRSMVEPVRVVAVRRPNEAFAVEEPEKWHYTACPNLDEAQREHDALVEILKEFGAEVLYHDDELPGLADSIYVHDPAIVTDAGAIILRMGKLLRRGEEQAMGSFFERHGIPILYRLSGEAVAEAGDLLWLDRNTLAVGQGYRTNAEGLRQLGQALLPLGVEVIPVGLPEFGGPEACLHLMSLISLIDHDLAVIYRPLLPLKFRLLLEERGIGLVDVPDDEFPTMGPNVLALAPRECLALGGNPETKRRLEAAGCRVQTYVGNEISLKAEGGPTCLTRPILRR